MERKLGKTEIVPSRQVWNPQNVATWLLQSQRKQSSGHSATPRQGALILHLSRLSSSRQSVILMEAKLNLPRLPVLHHSGSAHFRYFMNATTVFYWNNLAERYNQIWCQIPDVAAPSPICSYTYHILTFVQVRVLSWMFKLPRKRAIVTLSIPLKSKVY
jgi:hypothetical protein